MKLEYIKKIKFFPKGEHGNLFSTMRKMDFNITLAVIFIFDIIILTWVFDKLKMNTDLNLNLTAIYAIVGAFLGSLFIFIMAEGLRDKEQLYKIKIFFKSSRLITIIILFLLFLAFLPFHENKFVLTASFIALFGFIVLSIYAISQIAVVTLNAEELWERHIDLFKNKIKEATRFSLTINSNKKEFYQFMNKTENKMQWLIPRESDSVSLKSLEEGTITNICLEKLKEIIKQIKKKKMEQTPIPTIPITARSSAEEPISIASLFAKVGNDRREKTEKLAQDQYKDITLHVSIGQKIGKGSDLLSYDNKILIDSIPIQKQLNNALSTERTTVIDEVKAELENYKSMIKKYIEEENTFQFERYFDLYFKLAEEFLNQLSKPYSYEEAKREITYFNSSSPLLDWLRDHIMTFFGHAKKMKRGNQFKMGELDEITQIKWFNYHLINLSKDKGDHLFFQMGFSLWIRQLYYLSQDTNNFNKKQSIEDHFKFFENHLIPTVFFGEQVRKETEGYAIHLLEILKNVFDWILREDKKFEFLNDFTSRISQIINNRSANLLHFPDNTLDMNRAFNEPKSYDSRKLQFLFGLGAYLDNLTRDESQIPDEKKTEFDNMQDTIKNFIMSFFKFPVLTPTSSFDLKSFLNIYSLMNEKEVDNFWSWRLLNNPIDGKWRQREDNTKSYFLKLIFEIDQTEFEKLNIEQIDSQTLPSLENLCFPNLEQDLKNLGATDQEKQKVKSFLEKVSYYQSQKIREYISKGTLEQNKILEFIHKFEESFKKSSYMRTLFKKQKITQTINDSVGFISQIEYKSYFMSHDSKPDNINLSLSYPTNFSDRMPESFSDGCSEAENRFLQSEILKECNKKEIQYSDFIQEFVDRNWLDTEVILVSNRYFLKRIEDSVFKIEENKDNKNVFEYYFLSNNKKIPLKFDFSVKNQNVNVIIFDRSRLPILKMFNPVKPKEEFFEFYPLKDKDIGVRIGIDAFSHNEKLMEFMIKNPPDWLVQKGNEKDQREYLSQMVNIKILQGLYLDWKNKGQVGESFIIKD